MARRSSSKISSASSDKPQSGQRTKSGPPASKFELIAELGRGGMATVYLARSRKRPDKLLVLKQLRADLAENPEFLAMFLEEARLAGKLQHPNIVETYEVGQDAGVYYIAMEYLEGLSLQAVLTKFGWKGEFSFSLQVFALIEALKALEHAYTQRDDDGTPLKIVHRDVSPPNIIITFDGQVKLVDFGIAKAANSHVETRTGLIKGKLTYMAPEQAQSGDVDSRTDIYSIGVMLWQAAAGRRRWKGIENTDVLKRLHAGEVSESPDAKKNGLPAIVDDIVLKAIAADPEHRFKSASAFRAALESLLRELDVDPSAKKVATFMTTHFGDARKRAAEVMKARIAELDQGKPSDTAATNETPTAMRVAVPATSARKKTSDTPSSDRPQVGGAAASLARKVNRIAPRPKKKLANATCDTATEASPMPPRRGRPLLVGAAGLAIAAALAFQAVHVYRLRGRKHSTATASSQAAMTAASNDTPPSTATAAILPAPAASAFGAEPSEDARAPQDPTTAMPRSQRGHLRHGHASAGPTPVYATPAVATTAPASPSPTLVTPAPLTVATSAPADSTRPSLDKQDPWRPNGTRTDRSDPWAREGSVPQH